MLVYKRQNYFGVIDYVILFD